ncbi:hypothetical protein K443DRAFT_670728 [Laccaria amethystina LaAM-08-1]|uniref:histidine kinase n=1 Tax=Laccaria amethystina LaAM-08-1 TaxID=1095629 RepID=A0A0C9YPY7_9AGAR|nr:hypothetical protein K443DRAFT_670728 [Laccaria amethystina LaAM-08-1]
MYDRPAVEETAPASLPSLHLNGLPSQLAGHISNPPRLCNHAVRMRPPRRSNRPSTAPSKEDVVLLPSLLPTQSFTYKDSVTPSLQTESSSRVTDTLTHLQTVNEDDIDVCSGNANLGYLSPPFDSSEHTTPSNEDAMTITNNSDCDWATFITAYASGRWDPRRTPNPPQTCQRIHAESYRYSGSEPLKIGVTSSPSNFARAKFAPGRSTEGALPNGNSMESLRTDPTDEQSTYSTVSPPASSSISGPSLSPTSVVKFHGLRPAVPLNISVPIHRLRNSFSASASTSNNGAPTSEPGPSSSATDVQATAATMRWAAARVDISPLALPSPEHELTDPMRGVTASIPGSHSQDASHDLGSETNRRSRLTSFWEGTTDVEPTRLPTIDGSPSEPATNTEITPSPNGWEPILALSGSTTHLALLGSIPPASAPALDSHHAGTTGSTDYFCDTCSVSPGGTAKEIVPPIILRDSSPIPEVGTMSVPALPRRVCLTRQTSSPLPVTLPQESLFAGTNRMASENLNAVKAGRAAKEEQMYTELGYLAPPNPPDELERRRALYKFNIWNTGSDLNFDRIAHLAKLVFNTRGVVVSLIDGNEQWFKSEWGIKTPSCARAHSFCGHSILQRGDEPMVVLDTHLDWRFAKNPLVVSTPNIRFYAGAPLRTLDGYNIGTLAVIDDTPRDDFSPRQRHTLKEFAAIAMREMELWRDKIQLRIRDRIQNSMEQFSRECLETDTEIHAHGPRDLIVGSSMDKVYDRAAKLVQRTLDVEGVIVMDVSHCEVLESMNAEGSVSVTMHHGDPNLEMTKRQLSTEEYHKLNSFFAKYPDGKISEGIIPPSFRPFLPTHIQYALTVPIFNIDKRPFALLCAYNANDHSKRFLEGHELSYLRAIGVIILSAVLKRRMILADKAKSLFISNISHELRTPLHGILAAAELLSESPLNHSQISFIQTVQACGTSLVETVNHVLDFTKLSGNAKAGGVENIILPAPGDLMQLIEEAIDGCWIGHRARTASTEDSGIGSVYSPPHEEHGSPVATRRKYVETVVDIGHRPQGWFLQYEKGGIRRVLMNLFGNSLKFTSDGFVHVMLRQIPLGDDDPPNKVKIELSVNDSGKGISQNFLKNQLFHPFSQENPLQTGTGLGLAIVSSIVTSETVKGKVDVWSEEGAGTEIKVTFLAGCSEGDNHRAAQEMEPFNVDGTPLPTVSLIGFGGPHKGTRLLNNVIRTYLTTWWGFQIYPGPEYGDIIILNEDPAPVVAATERRDTSHPFVILSAARGSPAIMSIAGEHERIGGFCRILYKPGGPSRLRTILKLCNHALKIGSSRVPSPILNDDSIHPVISGERTGSKSNVPRRNSEESHSFSRSTGARRPMMTPRSSTAHPVPVAGRILPPTLRPIEAVDLDNTDTTVTVGSGGTLLKSSIGSLDKSPHRSRVLVVEDNGIIRNLLIKWLSTKGYDFRDAVDGRDGVSVYKTEGPFDVVLLDLSMPVLDGVSATAEIRRIEKSHPDSRITRILALTGMSSLEDKRRAFEAGVDGYLVKPVAFKTLEEMFRRLGIS